MKHVLYHSNGVASGVGKMTVKASEHHAETKIDVAEPLTALILGERDIGFEN